MIIIIIIINCSSSSSCCCCDVSNLCSLDIFSTIISRCSSCCCDISYIYSIDFLSIINYCYDCIHVVISCLSDLPLSSICECFLGILRICVD